MRKGKSKKSGRKRGGQPGHGGAHRVLLPLDQVDEVINLFPTEYHHDVEPTNNHAEREIRAFVLWRKRSYGTQSERGNLFAERIMTVVHTARKQKKNVFEFLTACCRAQTGGTRAPLLFRANAVPP